jgi:biopolymer transport protein ExbB
VKNNRRAITLLMVILLIAGGIHLTQVWAQNPPEVTESPATEGIRAWKLIENGGWVMVIIIAISFISLALIFYHFFLLRSGRSLPREAIRQVWFRISEGKMREALELCNRSNSAAGRIMAAGISRFGQNPQTIASALEVVGEKEAESLTDRLMYLSNISTITPMLGLLGTVLGMIRTFQTIFDQASVIKPWNLAGGISQALVTTAAGLIVAIPTMAMYYYFKGSSRRILTDLEQLSEELMEKLTRTRPGVWQEPKQ